MSSLSGGDAPYPGASTSRSIHPRHDLIAVVLAGLLWGTGGLTGALLGRVADLHPMAVATYRLAGGGLLMLAALAATGRLRRPDRPASVRVLLIGLLAAVYQAAYFGAVALTGVAVATLVAIGAAPALVLLAEAVLDRRRPGTASLAAAGLAMLGLALLVGRTGPVGGPGTGGGTGAVGGAAMAGGVALALVASAGFGALTLLGRRPVAGLDAPAAIGMGFVAGAALLAAVAGPTVGLGFTPGVRALGLLGYFGCVPTALAYGLYFAGLRGVPAGSAAVVAVLEPVTATVLGVLVLGDRLGTGEVVGAVLLCAAAVLAGLRGT